TTNDVTTGDIETDHLILVEARAGKPRQGTSIDVSVVEVVMPGDEAGQHAGIGRVHLPTDQGEAHARDRLHAEHAQHRKVGMAGTDQHHVLDHWMGQALHASPSSPSGRPIRASPGASDSRVGIVSIRNRRRRPREKASTAIDSNAVTRSRTTATSSLNSDI